MSYVLDDYVASGYVDPFSVSITGLSKTKVYNGTVALTADSTAFPLGNQKVSTLGMGSNVFVKYEGMNLDFRVSAPTTSAAITLPHNNAGSSIGGLITPAAVSSTGITNYVGGVADLTYTSGTYQTQTSFTYNTSSVEDWAYQVTTYPGNRVLNYGIITSDSYLEMIIYNKRRDAITFTGVDIPEELGCVFSGLIVGQEIAPLSQQTVRITAKLLSRNLEVQDFLTLNFDKVNLDVYIIVYRQPIVVYSLFPDRNSYSEAYSYKTSVFTTASKKEKRRGLMDVSKRTTSYRVTPTTASDAAFLENTLYSGLYNTMYQPMWAFASKTTEAVISNTVIPCETYTDVFRIGEYAGIYINEYIVILASIIGVDESNLYISQEVTLDKGSYIVPLYVAMPEPTSHQSSTASNHTINVKLKEL